MVSVCVSKPNNVVDRERCINCALVSDIMELVETQTLHANPFAMRISQSPIINCHCMYQPVHTTAIKSFKNKITPYLYKIKDLIFLDLYICV